MPNFADPLLLFLGVLIAPVIWLLYKRHKRAFPSVPLPSYKELSALKVGRIKPLFRYFAFGLKILSLMLLIIAIARPQSVSQGQDVSTEGIDIIMTLDISASMRARDFTPDRAEAAKKVAKDFIMQRSDDRIGIVLFAKQAFTQCPLTIDHAVLLDLVDAIEIGLADPDNTAIGQALGVALNRLEGSESKSKIIILLTDGENNFGQPPTTLAEAAQALNIKIYTIGVGTLGTAPFPFRDPFGRTSYRNVQVSIDEDLLKEIASSTGGKYFRATDDKKLEEIFQEINQMEKTKIEVIAYRRYAELFYNWAWTALIFSTISWLISVLYLRRLA